MPKPKPFHESVVHSLESAGRCGLYRPMFIRFMLDEIQRTIIPTNHAKIMATIDKVIKAGAYPSEFKSDCATVFKYLRKEKKRHAAIKKKK